MTSSVFVVPEETAERVMGVLYTHDSQAFNRMDEGHVDDFEAAVERAYYAWIDSDNDEDDPAGSARDGIRAALKAALTPTQGGENADHER